MAKISQWAHWFWRRAGLPRANSARPRTPSTSGGPGQGLDLIDQNPAHRGRQSGKVRALRFRCGMHMGGPVQGVRKVGRDQLRIGTKFMDAEGREIDTVIVYQS